MRSNQSDVTPVRDTRCDTISALLAPCSHSTRSGRRVLYPHLIDTKMESTMDDQLPTADTGAQADAGTAPRATAVRAAPPPESRPCAADDEPMGGDPPCWAHLFEDDETDQGR